MSKIIFTILFVCSFFISKSQNLDKNTNDAFKDWESKITNLGTPDVPTIPVKSDRDRKKSNNSSPQDDLQKLFEESNKVENTAKYSYNTRDVKDVKQNSDGNSYYSVIIILVLTMIVTPLFLKFVSRKSITNNDVTDETAAKNKENIQSQINVVEQIKQLQELERLKSSGMLTMSEFNKLKSKILNIVD